MGKNHQQNNLNRIFGGDCSSAGGGLGSTHCSSGGANEAVGNIYRSSHDVSSSFQSLNNGNISTASLQPLDNFPYSTTRPFKSPGGEMAANFGISFTSAQWKELERQAMIYKCMISSVPVPPDLLFPLSTAVDSSRPSLHNGRYSKKWDPEPGRCKRTDGKKWRCSREAAPHQRHCEHHLHRGKRSRSRKPVEMKTNLENHKKTSLQQKNPAVTEPEQQQQQPHLFNEKTDPSISADFCHKGTDRDLYVMDGTKDGKYLVEPSMGLENEGSSIYGHNAPDLNIDHMDVFSYSTFPTPKIEYPTGFINSWSIDNFNSTNNGIDAEYSASASDENLSPSLTVSMAIGSGDVLDGEMGNIQMMESGIEDNDVYQKSEDLRLLGPVSWEPFGPLAEAMHPPASPYDPVISNPATYNVSSPSEVLHRTSISQYDSSPALDVPQSEVTFHWFS